VILIVALSGDLHALVVRDRIRETSPFDCHVVASDALVDTQGFVWRPGRSASGGRATLPTSDGTVVDIGDCGVVWWRRASYPQLVETGDALDDRFVTAEWTAALRGALGHARAAAWVSDPEATRRAANKPLQLQAAIDVGWDIPETLVSQDREEVIDFVERAPARKVVMKALGSTYGRGTATVEATPEAISASDPAALALCPSIYQHVIPGREHLRVNVWGNTVAAFMVQSDVLDWRRDQGAPIAPVHLVPEVEDGCRAIVARLGLAAGVVDAKVVTGGAPVFLEVNPQGQFLFLEGATGVDLTGVVAGYLVALAAEAAAAG
jgi:glutathione synthase/RimK-type ligase-like ATP-grasp enzyme